MNLSIGISTCPNDTFIYQNLIEGIVEVPCNISVEYADVQTLNEKVLQGDLDMAKVSCAIYPLIKDEYRILDSGGAMGYGCGPLLLSSICENFNENFPIHLPGKNTTAAALFNFWAEKNKFAFIKKYTRFDKLYKNLCEKKIEQGVTIHEHRFTWQRDGLHLITDLGAFWEQELKVPIPLGCTVIRRSLGEEFAKAMDLRVQKSLRLAWERKEPVNDFIRKLAQIDDDAVILQHIKMFVNEYSMNRGKEGERALDNLCIFLNSNSMTNKISELATALNSDLGLNSCVAYRVLSERGKRIYFPSKGILGQSAEAKGAEINATIGTAFENDGAPLMLPVVKKSISLPEKTVQSSFLYQPSFGSLALRKKWREKLVQKNKSLENVKFSEPVVTAALTHALSICGSLFINPGDTIILPDLYWDNYDLIFAEMFGANIKTFNTFENGNFDTAALAAALNEGTGKKIAILNFPNNPAGYTVKNSEAKEICNALTACAEKGNDVVAILDDAYFGLVYENGIYEESLFGMLSEAHKNLLAVKLDGPTKEDYVWGFRVGFITFAFKDATEAQLKALENKAAGTVRATISNAPSLSQEILLNAYSSESYEAERQEKYNTLKSRYEKIKEILSAHKEYEQSFSAMPFNSGYFMCVKINGADPESVRKECLKNGLGVIFLSGLIRIAFSSVPLNKLEELFERLHKAVQAVR